MHWKLLQSVDEETVELLWRVRYFGYSIYTGLRTLNFWATSPKLKILIFVPPFFMSYYQENIVEGKISFHIYMF